MRKGFKKEEEFTYNSFNNQLVSWTIWSDTNNDNKKYLRLYVDAYGSHYGYVFGQSCFKPRSAYFPCPNWLYDEIMDKENTYDLYYDESIQHSISEILYGPSINY